jgi:hypothetical protein
MNSNDDVEILSSRNLSVAQHRETIVISYELSWPMTLGSQLRERDLRRRFKARLQRWFPQEIVDAGAVITASWATADIDRAKSAITHVDHMLDAFRKERLIPKIVEEVLGISARERRRWIKDGRLSKSGTGHFKKGKTVFQFYLHRPEEIAKLAADPQIVAGWRAADGDVD